MKALKLIKTGVIEEKNLWHACLMQHIRDMLITSATPKKAKIKKEAEEFLLENNVEFRAICILAGYNPDKVRNSMIKLHRTIISDTTASAA